MNPRFVIRPPQSPAEWQTVRELLTAYWNEFEDKTCFTSFEEEMTNIENLYARPDKAKLIAIDHASGTIAGCVGLRGIAPGVAEMNGYTYLLHTGGTISARTWPSLSWTRRGTWDSIPWCSTRWKK